MRYKNAQIRWLPLGSIAQGRGGLNLCGFRSRGTARGLVCEKCEIKRVIKEGEENAHKIK